MHVHLSYTISLKIADCTLSFHCCRMNVKFRNYVPLDKRLQEHKLVPPSLPKFEDPVASLVEPEKTEVIREILILFFWNLIFNWNCIYFKFRIHSWISRLRSQTGIFAGMCRRSLRSSRSALRKLSTSSTVGILTVLSYCFFDKWSSLISFGSSYSGTRGEARDWRCRWLIRENWQFYLYAIWESISWWMIDEEVAELSRKKIWKGLVI